MRSLTEALRRSPVLVVGTVMTTFLVGVALLAPWISPYDPKGIDPAVPALDPPSAAHLLGTNDAGSDNFSRLIWGSRTTLLVAVSATAIVLVIGLVIGLVAGLRGGFIDLALMRVVDVFMALPVLPLVILIAALAGPTLKVSILMIGLFGWPPTARIVRSQTLSLRSRGFIDSARGFGAGPVYVMRRHLIPALGPVIAANLVFVAGVVVWVEAGLSFLGLGDPSVVSWGEDLNRAINNGSIRTGTIWIWWLLPVGLALTFAIFSISLIGMGLEPAFNPRTNRART